jgi:toxin ParE1/3/4
MIWTVDYAQRARQDLTDIYAYISETLLEPDAAKSQVQRIMDAADSLERLPLRHHLYDAEPWHSRGLRIMPVDSYAVLYLPNEAEQAVTIIRVMYGGRDIAKHLNNTQH